VRIGEDALVRLPTTWAMSSEELHVARPRVVAALTVAEIAIGHSIGSAIAIAFRESGRGCIVYTCA